MAAGDEKQDELEKLLGKSDSISAPRPSSDFTRAFFGGEPVKQQNPADAHSDPQSYSRPASTPSEFSRIFGPQSGDLQPPALDAGEQPQPPIQNVIPSSEPGTSTGLFAAPSQVPLQPSAQAPLVPADPHAAMDSYPRPASTPGQFTRFFGSQDRHSQPPALNAEERPQPAMQNAIPSADPGTSTGLFAAPSQVPPKPSSLQPVSPQPGTFTALFHSELPAVGPVQPSADFRPLSSSAGPAPSLRADALGQVLPGIKVPDAEKSREDVAGGLGPFPAPNPGHNQDKATRIFSTPQGTVDRPAAASSPSAFTRVIASSDQRLAEEKNAPSPVPVSTPAPQAAAAPVIPVSVVTPQLPSASMSVPVQPSGYVPQQLVSPQVAMPPAVSTAWPQTSSPALQMQQPSMESDGQTPQKWWITYLPLIIGLNLLFFLAVILILIFALTR